MNGLDLMAFYAPHEGDGRRNTKYEPRMMVKLLIYGYATGEFSSFRIAKRLEEDVAFRMLAGAEPSAASDHFRVSPPTLWWTSDGPESKEGLIKSSQRSAR